VHLFTAHVVAICSHLVASLFIRTTGPRAGLIFYRKGKKAPKVCDARSLSLSLSLPLPPSPPLPLPHTHTHTRTHARTHTHTHTHTRARARAQANAAEGAALEEYNFEQKIKEAVFPGLQVVLLVPQGR
jgi:hypothetical protein